MQTSTNGILSFLRHFNVNDFVYHCDIVCNALEKWILNLLPDRQDGLLKEAL